MAPDKPSSTTQGGTEQTDDLEGRGRDPKEEPTTRTGLGDGQYQSNGIQPEMAPDKPSSIARGGRSSADDLAGRGRVPKEEPTIRVGLSDGQSAASVVADDAYVARDALTRQELGNFSKNKVTKVTVQGRQLAVNGKAVSAKEIRFSIADSRTMRYLSVAGKKYHGDIVLRLAQNGTITVINEVKFDNYIDGVISKEMGPSWPIEALKAQAVAARTFAAYSLGLHDEDGYDVCATTHCQVYGGIGAESPEGLRAVSATRGEVMTYQDKPIYAAFHASSGGMTAGSEEAGGIPLPYLQAVRDHYDDATPNRNWQVSKSATELSSALADAGFRIGTLKAIELTPLKIGESASDRFASGRLKEIRFVGTAQTVTVPGPKFRWIVGLPSTLVEIRYGTEKKTTLNEKGKIEISSPDTVIVFFGTGRGHGVGLSQWGAKAMAEKKKKYRDILNHYYTNVEYSFLF